MGADLGGARGRRLDPSSKRTAAFVDVMTVESGVKAARLRWDESLPGFGVLVQRRAISPTCAGNRTPLVALGI